MLDHKHVPRVFEFLTKNSCSASLAPLKNHIKFSGCILTLFCCFQLHSMLKNHVTTRHFVPGQVSNSRKARKFPLKIYFSFIFSFCPSFWRHIEAYKERVPVSWHFEWKKSTRFNVSMGFLSIKGARDPYAVGVCASSEAWNRQEARFSEENSEVTHWFENGCWTFYFFKAKHDSCHISLHFLQFDTSGAQNNSTWLPQRLNKRNTWQNGVLNCLNVFHKARIRYRAPSLLSKINDTLTSWKCFASRERLTSARWT